MARVRTVRARHAAAAPGLARFCWPGGSVSALEPWEDRLEAVAALASAQDIRMICGMPSWLIVFFERLARRCHGEGRRLRDLRQLWPRLSALIHGGVSFPPYAAVFDEWMGGTLHRVEVYPASEGFIAVQTELAGGLTLMLDYGIFYEFVPVEDVGLGAPRRHTVAEVETGRPYAVVMSTPGGLWSYLLGDTVRFTARDPLRLVITGHVRHYVSAVGENVIVEEVERALTTACRRTGAEVVEFTVAPRYGTAGEPRGSHEWLVEFRVPPAEPHDFLRIIDESLAAMNTDYRTKRTGDVALLAPAVTVLARDTFHRWMRDTGKLGDQHKVPRVTNDRALAEALLDVCGTAARPAYDGTSLMQYRRALRLRPRVHRQRPGRAARRRAGGQARQARGRRREAAVRWAASASRPAPSRARPSARPSSPSPASPAQGERLPWARLEARPDLRGSSWPASTAVIAREIEVIENQLRRNDVAVLCGRGVLRRSAHAGHRGRAADGATSPRPTS